MGGVAGGGCVGVGRRGGGGGVGVGRVGGEWGVYAGWGVTTVNVLYVVESECERVCRTSRC